MTPRDLMKCPPIKCPTCGAVHMWFETLDRCLNEDCKSPIKQGIISAVAVCTASAAAGGGSLGDVVQAALTNAVKQALADGIDVNDSEAIKERIMAARELVLSGA